MLKKQVIEGLPYAAENLPRFSTPTEIFNYLKPRTKYKSDPPDIELFMTMPTFFENNYHGSPGYGDCDDFSITQLTSYLSCGLYNCGIVLVGRNPDNAVHIYTYCYENGKKKYFDLTNSTPEKERSYNFRQEIPLKIDNNLKKKINMQLQLADNIPAVSYDPGVYIHLPSKGVQIRRDIITNMPLKEMCEMLSDEGYTGEQIAVLSAKRSEKKADKKSLKPKNVKAQSKAAARTTRADAKVIKAQNPKTRPSFEDVTGGITSVIDSTGKVIKAYKGTPDNEVNPETEQELTDTTTTTKSSDKILGMDKKTAYMVGGGLALLVIGGLFLKNRKNK